MVDFILNMPLRLFARVFGNPAGDPVLLKSRGVTLLRDTDSQLDMPLHSVFGVCIVCWEIFGKPLAYSREFSEKERLKMSHLYSKEKMVRRNLNLQHYSHKR